jgi:SSS family transporter
MLHSLTLVDLLIGLLYLAGTTLLALWLARRQRDLRSYFVGDRNVPWWLILFSIIATETSTVTFLSVPGLAFNPRGGNLTFLQLALGFALGRVVVAFVLLPQYMRGELFSAYQLLRQRFSPTVQRTASAIFLLARNGGDGLRLFLAGLLLQQITGWSGAASVAALGAVTIFYTLVGGMKAVIWTDLIQFLVYLSGAVVAAIFLVQLIPGGLPEYIAVGREAGKFRLLDLSLDPTHDFTLWAGLIGGAFISMASHGADQMMVQRYLCARSLGQARAAVLLSGVFVFVQFALFLLIGVGLFVLHTEGQLRLPANARPDQAFGAFIIQELPAGVVGLVLAAVLATAMSTLSGSLNSSASAFVNDFYRPLRGGGCERHYLNIGRMMTFVWGLVQIGVALLALWLTANESIVRQVLAIAGLTTGLILGLFLLGSLRHPVRSRSALLGLVSGVLFVVPLWLLNALGRPLLAWTWYAPVGTLVTFLVGLFLDRLADRQSQTAIANPQPTLEHGPPAHRSA